MFVRVYFIAECSGPPVCCHKNQCPFRLCSYRYTLDDLFPMMHAVKQRAELYDDWASLVTETLEAKLEKKKGKQQKLIRKQGSKGPHK